jgi:hypothetical protein
VVKNVWGPRGRDWMAFIERGPVGRLDHRG